MIEGSKRKELKEKEQIYVRGEESFMIKERKRKKTQKKGVKKERLRMKKKL